MLIIVSVIGVVACASQYEPHGGFQNSNGFRGARFEFTGPSSALYGGPSSGLERSPPEFGGHPEGFGFGVPPVPRELPPIFLNILPQEALDKLRAVHESITLSNEQKHDQIDKIMSSLPPEVLDRLPTPPAFERLPQDIKDRLKEISRDKSLNWRQKHEKIQQLMMSLPESIKRLLPPPPPFPGFEILPEDVRVQIQTIHEDRSLGFRERYYKVKELLDRLPVEVRNKMPLPPPPPFRL